RELGHERDLTAQLKHVVVTNVTAPVLNRPGVWIREAIEQSQECRLPGPRGAYKRRHTLPQVDAQRRQDDPTTTPVRDVPKREQHSGDYRPVRRPDATRLETPRSKGSRGRSKPTSRRAWASASGCGGARSATTAR